MPLLDRPEFRAWLDRQNTDLIGRRHGDSLECTACGENLDPRINSRECLVCLAERFGAETAETWLAEAVAGFITAAASPPVLAPMLSELVVHARDIAVIHAPADPA